MDAADLIVRNARVTTLRGSSPEADAFAVRGEKFLAAGAEATCTRSGAACSTTSSCGGTGWTRCNAAWR
jgi:predicted amidohydrolase YtcJ